MKKFFKKFIKSFIKIMGFHPGIRAKLRSLISSSKFLSPEFRYQLRGISESCWDEEILEAKIQSGMRFFYPNKSIIGLRAVEFGIWNEFLTLLDIFLLEAKIIVEVGSNIGVDTLSMAKRIRRDCKIIAFEPCDRYRAVLIKNIKENNLKNVSVYNYFLSSKTSSEVKLYITSSSVGGVDGYPSSFPVISTQTCSSITLDEFFSKNLSLESLDFLKIDTDGWNQHVVEGGVNTIKKFQPFLFVEFADYLLQKAGNSNLSFVKLLHQLGYNDFFVFGSIGKPPIYIKGYEKLLESLGHGFTFNVFAIPKIKVIK